MACNLSPGLLSSSMSNSSLSSSSTMPKLLQLLPSLLDSLLRNTSVSCLKVPVMKNEKKNNVLLKNLLCSA